MREKGQKLQISFNYPNHCLNLTNLSHNKNEQSLNIFKRGNMDFDWRILIVLLPLILAGGWAIKNIGVIALKQLQSFLNKQA